MNDVFKERVVEWAIGAALLIWGIITLCTPGLFAFQEFFHPLLTIGPQVMWGTVASIVGTLRLILLYINGAWRPSSHLRAIACGVSAVIWSGFLVCGLTLPWVTPNIVLWGLPLILDLFCLSNAAGDAKIADISAKQKGA